MPRLISDEERERTRQAIISHTVQIIITKKGIRNITVDDIVRSASVSKSAFYSYFKTKEECLYEVFKGTIVEQIRQADLILQESLPLKETAIKFLHEVYLAENSINHFFDHTDLEVLFRKLPPEYSEKEQMIKGGGIVAYVMESLGFDETQGLTFTMLLACINFVATFHSNPNRVKEETIECLVLAIADYIDKNGKRNEQKQIK